MIATFLISNSETTLTQDHFFYKLIIQKLLFPPPKKKLEIFIKTPFYGELLILLKLMTNCDGQISLHFCPKKFHLPSHFYSFITMPPRLLYFSLSHVRKETLPPALPWLAAAHTAIICLFAKSSIRNAQAYVSLPNFTNVRPMYDCICKNCL